MFTRRWLRNIGEIHSLLRVLSNPRMRCSKGSSRAQSRLFLGFKGNVNRAVRNAARLGLIERRFMNPYFIGHGEYFVSLTARGDRCVDAAKPEGR